MYTAGTVILPTVDNGRCFYCSVGGTSGGSEPTWPGRFPGVLDGSTLTWVPYTVITPQTIRDIMEWDTTTASAAAGPYSDTIIGNHLLDSIGELEKTTRRFFVNRPGFTWQVTSNGAPMLPLPGIRSASSVTWQGAVQVAGTAGGGGSGYALLPDIQQTGVYTSIQFRPLRTPDTNGPWWLSLGGANGTDWFSTGADNPYDPRNYGGGYVYTSTALDTVIVGDWGYAPGSEPNPFVHALEVLASFAQMRRLSLLADSVITPQGGVLSYSQLPPEIRQFCTDWSAGQQVVSVG
jgi:hypothetical protein